MMRSLRLLAAAAALMVVIAACGESAATPTSAGTPTTAPTTTGAPPATPAPTTPATPTTVAPTTPTTVAPTTPTTVAPTTTTTTKPPADPVADGSGCTPGEGDLPDGRWYGLVQSTDGTQLTFDLACWFSGAAAVQAAAQDGAEPPANDYYVRNQNPATRKLATTAEAEVVWYPNVGDPASETTTTYADWEVARSQRDVTPGIWVQIAGGVVTSIHEQWVP